MAWAYRSSSYANDSTGWTGASSGATHTVTLGAAVSAGDLLVLVVGSGASGNTTPPTFSSVTDSVNGSWSATADQTGTWVDSGTQGARLSVYSFPNSAAGTPTITVTVNTVAQNCFGGLQCAAFSGIATSSVVDVSVFGSGTSSAATSGNTSATGASSELVLGGYFDLGYNTTITQGTGFTMAGEHQNDGGNYQGMIEYKDSGSSGSTPAATASQGASTIWGIAAVVYKLSGGGGGTQFYSFIPLLGVG